MTYQKRQQYLEPDRLEYPLHDTQDYKSCIEFGTIQEEGVDLKSLIGFGSLFGKNETIEGEEGRKWKWKMVMEKMKQRRFKNFTRCR